MRADATVPPPAGEKRRLVVNTLLNGSSQFAAMLASLVFMPLLVKSFGITNYGLFMLASSVTAYAALLDLGVGAALTKMVAEYDANGDRDALSGSAATALFFYLAVGIIIAAAMGIIGAFAGSIFDVDGAGAENLRNMLWLGALFQLWYWPASTARHVLAGLQRYDVLAGTGLLATVLGIGATLYVIMTGDGPLALVALMGAATTAVSFVNIAVARRLGLIALIPFSEASVGRLRAIFAFSWAVFVIQVADALFYQQTDRVLLGIFAGAAAVGLYEAAAKFNVVLTYLSGLTVSAVMPLASSMFAQGRHASLRSLFVRGTKYGAALIAPITVVLVVFAGPIIRIWLGEGFASQTIVAQVLVFPHIVVCLGLMGDAIVISKGKLGKRVPYIFAQALLNVVLSAALIGPYGILGVAIGTAVSHFVDFPLHIRFLLKETHVSFADWLREVIAPVYPLLFIPAAVAVALSNTVLADSLVGIALAAAVAATAYWAAVALVGLSAQERAELSGALAAVRSRLPGAPPR